MLWLIPPTEDFDKIGYSNANAHIIFQQTIFLMSSFITKEPKIYSFMQIFFQINRHHQWLKWWEGDLSLLIHGDQQLFLRVSSGAGVSLGPDAK